MPKIMTISDFLNNGGRNTWVGAPGIQVYVRRRPRWIEGAAMSALDIANVSVVPRLQHKGVFTRWYEDACVAAQEQGLDIVYMENVFNPILDTFCTKRGFTFIGGGYCNNYYRRLK